MFTLLILSLEPTIITENKLYGYDWWDCLVTWNELEIWMYFLVVWLVNWNVLLFKCVILSYYKHELRIGLESYDLLL